MKTTFKILALIIVLLYSSITYADFVRSDFGGNTNMQTPAERRARLCCNTLIHYYETGHATFGDVLDVCQINEDDLNICTTADDFFPIVIEDMYNSCVNSEDNDGIADEEEDNNGNAWCDGDLSQDDATENSDSWCDTEEDPECAWYPSENRLINPSQITKKTLADMLEARCCMALESYFERETITQDDVIERCNIDKDAYSSYSLERLLESKYVSCVDEDGIQNDEEDDNQDATIK